jgi:hypothetical protein
MRLLLKVIGGLAIVLISFWATLYFITSREHENNQLRAKHAKLLAAALEKYRLARGVYPTVQGPVDDLKQELVEGKFLEAIPSDPARSATGQQYRYVGGGTKYGLLIILEPEPAMAGVTAAKPTLTCTVGVNIRGTGAWDDPPSCPF